MTRGAAGGGSFNAMWRYTAVTGGSIECSSTAFGGDPAAGYNKWCRCVDVPSAAPTTAPPTAAPSETRSLAPTASSAPTAPSPPPTPTPEPTATVAPTADGLCLCFDLAGAIGVAVTPPPTISAVPTPPPSPRQPTPAPAARLTAAPSADPTPRPSVSARPSSAVPTAVAYSCDDDALCCASEGGTCSCPGGDARFGSNG